MTEVLVIGGGLAGSAAALAAARRGAKVAISARSWGASALSTGAIDIAHAPGLTAKGAARTVVDHVTDIAAHRPNHPYGVLGMDRSVDGIQRGYALMSEALSANGLRLGPLALRAENLGLPSSLGALVPAAAAAANHLGLDLTRPPDGAWGVLQLCGDAYFDAERVRAGLVHDAEVVTSVSPDLRVIRARFDGSGAPLATARRLDDAAVVDELAAELGHKVKGLSGLIAPPVLGLQRHESTRQRLAENLGIPVVEALAHLPSVPGVRLQAALDAAVSEAGVRRIGEAVEPVVSGHRVRAVRTRDNMEVCAAAFVLATGRFVSGGVTWMERCAEALFGLPVGTEAGLLEAVSPHGVVRDLPMESHPLMTAGVLVGSDLRPMREGVRAYDNLFAAGMVVGGFASRYVLCADGVSLATGLLAGEAAVGEVTTS